MILLRLDDVVLVEPNLELVAERSTTGDELRVSVDDPAVDDDVTCRSIALDGPRVDTLIRHLVAWRKKHPDA